MAQQTITIAGAGIMGLWQAFTLARAGHRVRLIDAGVTPFTGGSSRWAGAMIAPECEAEAAPDLIRDLGREGLAIWRDVYPGTVANGTLVVAAVRDRSELTRFSGVTEGHRLIHGGELAELEPALSGRFNSALYYPGEAHVDAMAAMAWLLAGAQNAGAEIVFGAASSPADGILIDCRGMAARDDLPELRGVRGERVLIATKDVTLSRPVRLLHPRQPIYVVPRSDGRFVVGATVIEREDSGPMTLRSALDLLGAAYALSPAFAEAAILDMGVGVRPSFPDNVPRITIAEEGRVYRVNGAYRHGFLLAPVLARMVLDRIDNGTESVLIQRGND